MSRTDHQPGAVMSRTDHQPGAVMSRTVDEDVRR
jgi:hypothetical protein